MPTSPSGSARTPARRIRRAAEMEATDDARLGAIDDHAHLRLRLAARHADENLEHRAARNVGGAAIEARARSETERRVPPMLTVVSASLRVGAE